MILVARAKPPAAFELQSEYVMGIVLPNLEYRPMGTRSVYYKHSNIGQEQEGEVSKVWERPPLHIWKPQVPDGFLRKGITLRHFPVAIDSQPEQGPSSSSSASSGTSAVGAVAAALPDPVLLPFPDHHIEIAVANSIEDFFSAAQRPDALEEAQVGAVCAASRDEVQFQ